MSGSSPQRKLSSQLLGKIDIDPQRVERDLAQVQGRDWLDAYSEYSVGYRKISMLRNRTGRDDDGVSVEYPGSARPTDIGQRTPYFSELIDHHFNTEHLKSARLFLASEYGILFPHRDYLELKKGFHRIHIPLVTSSGSLNSEEDLLYHMNLGEAWFVDGHKVHSGGTMTADLRVHMILDFDSRFEFEELINEEVRHAARELTPTFVDRPDLDGDHLDSLYELSGILAEHNFRSVMAILAQVHYVRQVHAGIMYEWLIEIAQRSGKQPLVKRAHEVRDFFLGEQGLAVEPQKTPEHEGSRLCLAK